jgi:hypothetical protein
MTWPTGLDFCRKRAVPGKKPVIKDKFGDPLPEGALRRYGTLRFRTPGGIDGAALSPDGADVFGMMKTLRARPLRQQTGHAGHGRSIS